MARHNSSLSVCGYPATLALWAAIGWTRWLFTFFWCSSQRQSLVTSEFANLEQQLQVPACIGTSCFIFLLLYPCRSLFSYTLTVGQGVRYSKSFTFKDAHNSAGIWMYLNCQDAHKQRCAPWEHQRCCPGRRCLVLSLNKKLLRGDQNKEQIPCCGHTVLHTNLFMHVYAFIRCINVFDVWMAVRSYQTGSSTWTRVQLDNIL